MPAKQVSTGVQKSPLSQPVPLSTAAFTQPEGEHESVVQGLLSSQSRPAWLAQAPPAHVSSPLQKFPSSQTAPSALPGPQSPVLGLQTFAVHGLPSLSGRHVTGAPPLVHTPP
jgi:hypothetical protein